MSECDMTNASENRGNTKPWEHAKHGEGSSSDPLAARFVESLSYDTRLYGADIRGSVAHARMLAKVGLISADDLAAIERGLAEIKREIQSAPAGPTAVGVPGAWSGWNCELEDVHMCIEAALTAKVGEPGKKLHTGRSRNDQVALDLRLWLREACAAMAGEIAALSEGFVELARRQGDMLLPTYTHVQRAQPACVGAECMAWWAMFERDRRLLESMPGWEDGLAASPLGSGAVAGSTLPLDRWMTAAALGFDAPSVSSIDATASRDEAMDYVYALSRLAVHMSRFAEQWILYCSTEFGFLTLDHAHTTGSSMMPQKRNPDMLELIRGRCAPAIGHMTAMATLVKGLPLAYNRDLQEDKRIVFACHDSVLDSVRMATRIVRGATFKGEAITATLNRGHLDATVLAEYLVGRNVPFRTAHQIVGALVRLCDDRKKDSLSQLTLEEFQRAAAAAGFEKGVVEGNVFEFLGAANVVKRYRSAGHGGTSTGGYRDWLSRIKEESGERGRSQSGNAGTKPDTAEVTAPSSLFPAMGQSDAPAARRSAMDGVLSRLYEAAGRTLDDLPYTDEFAALVVGAHAEDVPLSAREIFHRLHNLRKAGKLARSGKAAGTPTKIDADEEQWLGEQVVAAVGSLGQRDQLPLTPAFDALVERFNARTGRNLSAHQLWRVVAKLAK
jgi:argininosuccinate lyase